MLACVPMPPCACSTWSVLLAIDALWMLPGSTAPVRVRPATASRRRALQYTAACEGKEEQPQPQAAAATRSLRFCDGGGFVREGGGGGTTATTLQHTAHATLCCHDAQCAR